jgi:hypothetical protein
MPLGCQAASQIAHAYGETCSILQRARKEYVSPIDVARQYAYLVFDFLHADERHRKLVKEIGLPTTDCGLQV